MITLRRGKKTRQDFDQVIGEALQQAERGNVEEAIRLIKDAWHLSNRYGLGFRQIEADFIKNVAYQRGLATALDSARYWASEGDVPTAMKYVNAVNHYASVVGAKPSDEVLAAIAREAYSKGAEKKLEWASRHIQDGLPIQALQYIAMARQYASRAGLDINDRVQQLIREVQPVGAQTYLKLAREDAEKGYLRGVEISLKRARKFAQMSGVDINPQIQEIEKVAYAHQAANFMGVAQSYTNGGFNNRARIWMSIAQQSASRGGTTIDNVVK